MGVAATAVDLPRRFHRLEGRAGVPPVPAECVVSEKVATDRAAMGPYAGSQEPRCLLGQSLAEIEASDVFRAAGLRMRKMMGRERVYVGAHTDVWLRVDDRRLVQALLVSLLPPDRDVEDDCFDVVARVDGGAEGKDAVRLSYGWALLVHLAHDVLGLGAEDAAALLNGIYRDGFLPRRFGDVELSLQAGRRHARRAERCLCLLARRVGMRGEP